MDIPLLKLGVLGLLSSDHSGQCSRITLWFEFAFALTASGGERLSGHLWLSGYCLSKASAHFLIELLNFLSS